MTVKVTIEVEDPEGYPEEHAAVHPGHPRNKRERQILTSYRRAVQAAKEELTEYFEDLDLTVEQTDGQVKVE